MVIERPVAGFSGWGPEAERRGPSPRAIAVAAAIVGVHLAGAAYLYTARIAPRVETPEPGPVTLVDTVRLPHDEPKPDVKQPPKIVPVHKAVLTTPQTVKTLDAPPQHDVKPSTIDGPPDLAKDEVKIAPDAGGGGKAVDKVIRNPTWLARPSPEQLADFYPERALEAGISGQATLDCVVTASGQLTRCAISGETPRNERFGEAALKAARIFRMSPRTEDGQPVEGGTVHIPIQFRVKS